MTIEQSWNRMASAYEDFTESEGSYSYTIEWPCIQEMLPDLKGKAALDLGCGTGRFTFLLEKFQTRKVTGMDISQNMLDIAKRKAAVRNSEAEFIRGDVSDLDIGGKYDFVFSSTVTHYIKDLYSLFTKIYAALNKQCFCVISVMHPVYTAQYPVGKGDVFPEDDEWIVRYLDKRERSYIQPWIEYNDEIENYLSSSFHHTLGDYVNSIIKAGFSLVEIREPGPPEKWREEQPHRYNAFIETPSYMILKLFKP